MGERRIDGVHKNLASPRKGGDMQKFLSEVEKYYSSQTESKEGEERVVTLRKRK